MNANDAPNVQSWWCALLVEELVRQGLRSVVYGPGSRSSPLLLAAIQNKRLRVRPWLDERGAAYHALGYARASGHAAAVLTTSGTAVSNLLPAAREAMAESIPLLLLTADRPPELIDCGANQATEQTAMLRDSVRRVLSMPCPTDAISPRFVLSQASHAWSLAHGMNAGPVQLNCPFRKPLHDAPVPWSRRGEEDIARWLKQPEQPWRVQTRDLPAPPAESLYATAESLVNVKRGLLLAAGTVGEDALHLAEALGWPLIADVRSGLRLGHPHRHHTPHLDRALAPSSSKPGYLPEIVVQLGGRMTSTRVLTFLEEWQGPHLVVDEQGARHDVAHGAMEIVHAEPSLWCDAMRVVLEVNDYEAAALPDDAMAVQASCERAIEDYFERNPSLSEPAVLRHISRAIAQGHALFVGNSMPIRDLQAFAAWDGPAIPTFAQRGLSGIDGIVSTAAGCASGIKKPTTLVLGDLTLLHDLNALAMLRHVEVPLTVVVLNNYGGSIFSFLPIAESPSFSPHFDTPHTLDLAAIAAAMDLQATRATTMDAFQQQYEAALARGHHTLIEVVSSQEGNLKVHRALEAHIASALHA